MPPPDLDPPPKPPLEPPDLDPELLPDLEPPELLPDLLLPTREPGFDPDFALLLLPPLVVDVTLPPATVLVFLALRYDALRRYTAIDRAGRRAGGAAARQRRPYCGNTPVPASLTANVVPQERVGDMGLVIVRTRV